MKQMCMGLATLLLAMTVLVSAGCATAGADPREDGVLTIVATSHAGYDLARQLTGEDGETDLILLGRAGQDLHSYEPTAADIATLSRADLLITVGNEGWLEATLAASMNESVLRVDMMTVCDRLPESATEGMDTSGEDHAHDHDHGEGILSGSCALIGSDEHVWLSVENAVKIARAIADALPVLAPEKTALWQDRREAYLSELETLRADYAAMRAGAVRDTILIADRHPFAYLVRELDLVAYAAFPGCSSETSASFETRIFLSEKVKELALPYIFIIDGSDGSVARAVAEGSNAEILTLDSIQVVSDRSKTYVGIMRENLEALKRALWEA